MDHQDYEIVGNDDDGNDDAHGTITLDLPGKPDGMTGTIAPEVREMLDDALGASEVRPLPEPAADAARERPTPGTALALNLPPTGHELLSFAVQLERIIARAEKSEDPGMGKWGTVTGCLKSAATALRSAIGHTL